MPRAIAMPSVMARMPPPHTATPMGGSFAVPDVSPGASPATPHAKATIQLTARNFMTGETLSARGQNTLERGEKEKKRSETRARSFPHRYVSRDFPSH
jgi:hypothetical protein